MRRKDEGPKPWRAFQLYRDLGEYRSQEKVAEQLGKSRQLISRWSSQYEWVTRCAEWDEEIDRRKRDKQIRAIEEMAERHALMACMVQEKLIQKLNSLTDDEVESMSFNEVANLMALAVKQERQARGEPGEVLQERLSGADGSGPLKVEIIETVVRRREQVQQIRANPQAELLK